MGSAGIDDDLEIGFAGDRLTVRSWCPVVFLANQDESANRWVDAVVAERIVGDDPCDPAVPARSILRIGRLQRRNGADEKPTRKICFASISGIALSTATAARASLLPRVKY